MKKPMIIMAGTVFFCMIIPVLISVLFYKEEESMADSSLKNIEQIKIATTKKSPYINVYNNKTDTVENIQIEEFLDGVLAMEMSANFSMEALKAQAVAARTYIMYKIENNITSGHKGANICTDYSHCQAYASEEELKEAKGEKWIKESYPIIKQAVNSTRGQILKYNNKVILPPYFSTSSGITENSGEVFMTQYPYLKSVSSSYDKESPKYYTEKTIQREELIEIINKNCQGVSLPQITPMSYIKDNIKVVAKTTAGSVKQILVYGKGFSGFQFRQILGLNSSNFEMEFFEDEVVFKVKGYGHGVGMSQWGAQGMAKVGYNYRDILYHYYTDTEISKIY